ncbi:MAG: carbon-nitrogen hydrolase family protein [Bilifractor sp.]
MKITLAQIATTNDLHVNIRKTRQWIREAAGTDLLLFPEVQLTPFFPQYRADDVKEALGLSKDELCVDTESEEIQEIFASIREAGIWCSPNFYVKGKDGNYDTSFLVSDKGEIVGKSMMVYVANAPQFYEADYYTPSKEGFRVFDTPFGRIGIVICYDRHFPESVRSCAQQGAELVLIPTVNTKAEPLDIFEAEVVAEAYQNNVFIAMCNKVGLEGEMDFAGQSVVVDCDGHILYRADDREGLHIVEIDLLKVRESRKRRPYLSVLNQYDRS